MLVPEKRKVFGLMIPKQSQSYWPIRLPTRKKNYYQEELLVNERYDALELAKTWSTSLNIEKNEMGLKIFPFPKGIVMSIHGYRQSDKSLDFKFKTQPLKSGELFLSDILLKPGKWNLAGSINPLLIKLKRKYIINDRCFSSWIYGKPSLLGDV